MIGIETAIVGGQLIEVDGLSVDVCSQLTRKQSAHEAYDDNDGEEEREDLEEEERREEEADEEVLMEDAEERSLEEEVEVK